MERARPSPPPPARPLSILAAAVLCLCGAVALPWGGGCRTPFDPIPDEQGFRRAVDAAIERELALPPTADAPLTTTAPPSPVEAALEERRDELDAMTPSPGALLRTMDLGTDLAGAEHREAALTLRDAVHTAVRNNLGIAGSRLQPAIREQDVIIAEAVFDAVLFAGVEYERVRIPTTVPIIQGIPLGVGRQASDIWRFETGVRRDTPIGGTAFLSTDLTRSRNRAPNIVLSPDPAYAAAVRLGYIQPLLRGFGTDVNLATIRITRNLQRAAVEQLRADLMEIIAETEAAYWDLVFAWRNLEIQQWLLEEGVLVRDVLERRRDFDARPAEYADAVATVEQRRAAMIRARAVVRDASDRLKTLMNDPDLLVADEIVIAPSDPSLGQPLTYTFRDTLLTALANRPEVQQAVLAIDDARIREQVAANLRLPQLHLTAQLALAGLDDSAGRAYEEAMERDFINALFGLAFEYPIGNRAADAEYRRARLERSAQMLAYQQTVQLVIADVKNALRSVVTNFELIQAARSFRVAQAENLRALLVREELVGLTPEFLNLKFTRQNTLAAARQQEIQALVNFDQSVAQLHRAMGIGLSANQIDLEIAE